jgi:hypothetical protein
MITPEQKQGLILTGIVAGFIVLMEFVGPWLARRKR